MTHYKLKVKDDDNQTFLITSPDFPEVTTFAENEDDIERIAKLAIEEAICARMANKEAIPMPHRQATGYQVRFPFTVVLKIALYNEVLSGGQKRYGFGKSIGLKPSQIDRLFDIRYKSKPEIIEAAFVALNIEPELSFKRKTA